MAANISDDQLLEQIARRDESALERLYDRYNRCVYAFVLKVVGNPSEAEEVVLEIFWQVWQQAERFKDQGIRAFTWLMTISRKRALDRLKRGGREIPSTAPAKVHVRETAAGTLVEEPTLQKEARSALASLSALQRQALELAYYRGMTHVQIAAVLKEPAELVKSRIQTGLRQIRKTLNQEQAHHGSS